MQLTPRRHALTFRAGAERLDGAFDGVSRHAGAIVATNTKSSKERTSAQSFTNNTTEIQVMGSHRAVGRMKGSVGAWVLDRAFDGHWRRGACRRLSIRGGFAAFAYRRSHMAACDAPVRRPGRSHGLHSCRRTRARLHERVDFRRRVVPAGRGRRSPDDCGQLRLRRASARARRAVLLRRCTTEISPFESRQSEAEIRTRARASICHCAGAPARIG